MEIGVFHGELCLLLPNAIALEFGIKIGVEAEFVVKKFLVAKQGRIGPYCFQEKGLTPTGMGTDEIRYEAPFHELFSRESAALGADDLGFRLHHKGMDFLGVTTLKVISIIFNFLREPMPTVQGFKTQGQQLMLPIPSETPNDVSILAGKVLVDEENLHRLRDAAMIPLCPETHQAKAEGKKPYAT